jgi:hypothetical protein
MIKFFRKIRQDLLSKRKTGKYFKYAIGEIVLVVIGILIALHINNWNETNKSREQAKVGLMTISQNIKFDINQAKSSLSVSNKIISVLNKLLDQFMTIKSADNHIQEYLAYSMIESSREVNKSGINSLNEMGGLTFINQNLKTEILSYYELIDITAKREEISNSIIHNMLEPYIKKKNSWIYNKTNSASWISIDYENHPRPINENYTGLLSDKELEVYIWSRQNQEKKLLDLYLKLIETGEELINKIETEKNMNYD